MEIDLSQLLADLTGSAAVIVVLVLVLRPFVERLMDNLGEQAQSYNAVSLNLQEVSIMLKNLCDRMSVAEIEHRELGNIQSARQIELAENLGELGGVLRGLQRQQQAHEVRAQNRHEVAISQSEQRHREMMDNLRALNGSKREKGEAEENDQ